VSLTTVPRLSEAEVKQLAVDVVDGRIFLSNNPEAVRSAWAVPLAFMTDPIPRDCGGFFEEVSRAGARSINGYPTFFSFKMLHNDDLEPVLAAIEAYQAGQAGVHRKRPKGGRT
jgi:hypothetical protein